VFAASEGSTARTSRARLELQHVEELNPSDQPGQVVIALSGFHLPEDFLRGLYLTFKWSTRARDAQRATTGIEQLLAALAGFAVSESILPAREGLLVGGQNPAVLVDVLLMKGARAVYALNTILPFDAQQDIFELVGKLPPRDAARLLERLLEVFAGKLSPEPHEAARQNAIILAARCFPNAPEVATALRRRPPDLSSQFLFRGAKIALGHTGDTAAVADYVHGLVTRTEDGWSNQHKLNLQFHLAYYGGLEPTLERLRDSCHRFDPSWLLPLNVLTLATLSSLASDLQWLSANDAELRTRGVTRAVLDESLRRLKRRIER
jgi:hypothetical protein